MKPKQLLILSVVAGLLAVILVQFQLRKEKGSPVVVFRATKALRAGETLGKNVEPVTLPGDSLFPNLLKEAPTGEMEEFVSTTPLTEPIQSGELILFRHLETTVDPGIQAEIPPGHKAVSIPVTEVTSVSYLVQPGDSVDVLAALPQQLDLTDPAQVANLASSGGRGFSLETRPLLQAVTVLAVGRRYRRSDQQLRSKESYAAVTLLLSMEEAQKLVYARDVLSSPMTLALRSPGDTGKEPGLRPLSLNAAEFDRIGNQ